MVRHSYPLAQELKTQPKKLTVTTSLSQFQSVCWEKCIHTWMDKHPISQSTGPELRQPRLRPIEALFGFGGEYRSRKEGRNFDCSDSWRMLPDSRVLALPPASKLDFRE